MAKAKISIHCILNGKIARSSAKINELITVLLSVGIFILLLPREVEFRYVGRSVHIKKDCASNITLFLANCRLKSFRNFIIVTFENFVDAYIESTLWKNFPLISEFWRLNFKSSLKIESHAFWKSTKSV